MVAQALLVQYKDQRANLSLALALAFKARTCSVDSAMFALLGRCCPVLQETSNKLVRLVVVDAGVSTLEKQEAGSESG